jgi:hypothetical protein
VKFSLIKWHLIPSTTVACHATSSGALRSVTDLYSPRIFGANTDFRCSCGKLDGPSYVGKTCEKCFVNVEADAKRGRRIYTGHIKLAFHIPHPLNSKDITDVFPIAPIAYRLQDDESPNAMGRKYEELVKLNFSLTDRFPQHGEPQQLSPWPSIDKSLLVAPIDNILGTSNGLFDPARRADSLLGLFFESLARFDDDVHALARACCLGIEFSGGL